MPKQSIPGEPEVPSSKTVRTGDFGFTSAYSPWTFDPLKVVFDELGPHLQRRHRSSQCVVRRAGASDVRGNTRGAGGGRAARSTTSCTVADAATSYVSTPSPHLSACGSKSTRS